MSILLVELEVQAHNNIVNSLKIIHELAKSSHWRNLIIKIELFHLKEYLKFQVNNMSFNHKYHSIGQKTLEGFLLTSEFLRILTRATDEYLDMWKEFVSVYPIVTKLKKRLKSLLKATSKVHQTYKSLGKYNNKYSALFYYFYLHLVSKNEEILKEIKFDVDILKTRVSDIIQYENSVFVSIDFEGKFLEIGENIRGLLGFQRQDLGGKSMSGIIPSFCK